MQILVWLHKDSPRLVVGKSVFQQQVHQIAHEEDDERHCRPQKTRRTTRADGFVVHIVHYIEDAQHTGQEHHGQAKHQHPGVEQCVKTVGGVGPVADDGCQCSVVDKVVLLNDEI